MSFKVEAQVNYVHTFSAERQALSTGPQEVQNTYISSWKGEVSEMHKTSLSNHRKHILSRGISNLKACSENALCQPRPKANLSSPHTDPSVWLRRLSVFHWLHAQAPFWLSVYLLLLLCCFCRVRPFPLDLDLCVLEGRINDLWILLGELNWRASLTQEQYCS